MTEIASGHVNIRHPDKLFIGGEWVTPSSDRRFELISPVTEQPIGFVAEALEPDMDKAVAAARKAFDQGPWPRMTPSERGRYLDRLSKELHARHTELAHAWTQQIGVLFSFANMATPTGTAMFEYQASVADTYEWEKKVPTVYPGSIGMLTREPVGVVAAIAPWNAPFFTLAMKMAPAFIAGCTVIMKPSPETPLEAYILAECIEAAGFPPGVVNLVTADRQVSDYLVNRPGIDKVSFTGSTAAGRRIAAVCSERIARFTLELGGKSPAILLDDYDLDQAASQLAPALTTLTGQVCSNLTRYLVPKNTHDKFIDILAEKLATIKIGDPYDASSQMGPVAMKRQLERVEGYVAKGVAEGARLVMGGGRPAHLNRGYYFEPTIFANVDNRSTIAQEEIFGPVVCVTPYDNVDHAIQLANETQFGLNGSVFTNDAKAAYKVARAVHAGTMAQNGFKPDFTISFGGFKQSGIGREGGAEAVLPYLETKTIVLDATADNAA